MTLYDGGTVLADLDSAGNREAEYVYDEGTDRPYAMLTGSTAVTGENFYAQDDMGNVQGQFSDATHPTETVTYGDWGLPTVAGDTTNRFTWKGLSYDPDVGLTYMRSRWYDPNIWRFVSEDPLGLGGGINPYVFANNDPVNGSDPSGMSADPEHICKIFGFNYVSFTNGNGGCVVPGGDEPYQEPAIPVTAPGDSPFGDSPWTHTDPGPTGDGTHGGDGTATGPTSATKSTQTVRAACVAAGVAFGISVATDASWLVGIGEAVDGARIGARLIEFGESAGGGALERIVPDVPQNNLNGLQYGAKISAIESGRLIRDSGLSITAGG